MQQLPGQESESPSVRLWNALSAAAQNGYLRSCLKAVLGDQANSTASASPAAEMAEEVHMDVDGNEEAVEPAAKRRRSCADLNPDTLKSHVVALGGREFDVNFAKGEHVIDIKRRILEEQNYQLWLPEMRLILGTEILDDMVVLSDTSVKDGDNLTLVKQVGTMHLLLDQIFDNTQWHGRHKFALRSEPLLQEVEKIEVKVDDFQDQGWGGCQARLFIYLYNIADNKEIARMKIFGPLRTAEYDERKHRRSPSYTIGEEEPVVALARPGMVYKLRYQCGGGGGHSITVKNWSCKIFPKNRGTDEVTLKVNGSVNLRNTSRLGPDRATGKWELQEPPL
mmetsp:Transcript_156784/g.285265  ORF Transcript_156784/g.285265 Transcript_156784/m.285265 type:complete len:337 (-) Transcript_156784:73-1083(-)